MAVVMVTALRIAEPETDCVVLHELHAVHPADGLGRDDLGRRTGGSHLAAVRLGYEPTSLRTCMEETYAFFVKGMIEPS